jgi:hypothetical protein
MNKILVMLGCSVLLSAFSGCQDLGRSKSGVEVIIKGGGQFPSSLAGTWKANGKYWEITFEPNGVISSVVIPLASAKIRPGEITRVQARKGEPSIFEPGNIEVCFDPRDNELSVDIKIKRVYLDIGSIAEGPCEYFIVGNILEDGKTWQADEFTSLNLAVLTPDPNHREDRSKFKKVGRLDTNFSKEQQPLTFTKVPDGNTANNK